jgi:hypothetical protein
MWRPDLPIIAQEHSPKEQALKMPPRLIKYQAYVDRSRYTGAVQRQLRALRGVGRIHNSKL